MDAALGSTSVSIPDVDADERYADFRAEASRAGVRSSLSVGMPVPERSVGGLNLYAWSPSAFDEGAAEVAAVFANYVAVAVANAGLLASTQHLADQMRQAMATRAGIEQAKHMLMARTGCSPDEAFATLSRQSQQTNRKLVHIAAEVVAGTRTTV